MIAVFDDFIKDEKLLEDIANDDMFFKDPGVYYYWKGWWNSEAKSVKQRIIEYVWKNNYPLSKMYNIDGFEYWTGVQEADPNGKFKDYLVMHLDEDEKYRLETGNRMFPILGCVYYPVGSEFTGGALNVFTEGTNKPHDTVLPIANRLILFQAGQVLHSVDKVLTGTRRALAFNLWDKEPWSYGQGHFSSEQ